MQHGGQIEPGFVGVEQAFAHADHVRRDQDLIRHLRVLPSARAALMDDRFAHRFPARMQRFDDIPIAADHDREPRFARADVATGNGGIHAMHAAGLGRLVNFHGQRGLAGGHIDQDRIRAAAGERAVGGEEDFPHIAWEADDGEDDVAALGHLARRRSVSSPLVQQRLSLRFRAIVNRGGKTFRDEMRAHARPHHPRADPANSRNTGNNLNRAHVAFPTWSARSASGIPSY